MEKFVNQWPKASYSSLGYDGGSLEAALIFVEARIFVGFMTIASCLTTGAAKSARNLAVGNDEVISALAVSGLLRIC
jgi:hypothetical protein